MPYSDKDALLLDKVLNNKVVNLGLNKTSDDKLDTIPKNSTSQVYDDLIKRKDELIKSLENVDYKVEENIKEFKVVLGKLLDCLLYTSHALQYLHLSFSISYL